MKNISLIICILIFSLFSNGQTKTSSTWQEFSPGGEEFTVEVPDKLAEIVTVLKNADKKDVFAYGKYRTYFNGVYYFIFSELADTDSTTKFPALFDSIQSFIKKFSDSPETVTFDKYKGSKYEFKDTENFYHTIIFLKTDNRFYTFHTIREESPANETERFFRSIKFHDMLGQAKEQSAEEINRNLQSARNNNNNINVMPNAPSGIGSGSGRGSGSIPQATVAQTTGLTITSKPRANYTDLARDYEIAGAVMLRVTFLANGEIGAISPVKRLPLGLTDEAILAAKKINFTPAMINGKNVTVTKQVQYSFILY